MQPFTFFISHRRQDTGPIALLFKYELEKRLQFVRVFVDVEAVGLGERFPDRIKEMISESHVTIAMIGNNWMPQRASTRKLRAPAAGRPDWVVDELCKSAQLAMAYDKTNRYGLSRRQVLPIFVDRDSRFTSGEVPAAIAEIQWTQAERISYAEWPNAIGPLIERIAVKFKLKSRPDKDHYPTPDIAKARTQPVSDQELTTILRYEDYEGWYVDNFGNPDVRYLAKTFKFPHFNQAADFMHLASDHCRVLDHHPEWRNVFNHVAVALTTWDARRRVTIYDLNLALFMNKAAASVLAKR